MHNVVLNFHAAFSHYKQTTINPLYKSSKHKLRGEKKACMTKCKILSYMLLSTCRNYNAHAQ